MRWSRRTTWSRPPTCLLAMHDLDTARKYFEKARLAGANGRVIALGMANTYLAQGDTHNAQVQLAGLSSAGGDTDDYDYLMAMGNMYQQRRDTVHALSTFARANSIGGHDDPDNFQNNQAEVAGQEGRQITQKLSLFSRATLAPALEDINVYTLDAKINGVTDPALLPTPRHSFQSMGEADYRVHLSNVPTIQGFVGQSLTHGTVSFPSDNIVQAPQYF